MKSSIRVIAMGVLLLALFAAMTAAQADTAIDCDVRVNGEPAAQVESSADGAAAFRAGNYTIVARNQNSRRVQIQFLDSARPTKGAFVIAGIRDGKTAVSSEIYGQQMSISCLQK